MSKYQVNITGAVEGVAIGDGASIVIVNGRVQTGGHRSGQAALARYKAARALGLNESTALEYAAAPPADDDAWVRVFVAEVRQAQERPDAE